MLRRVVPLRASERLVVGVRTVRGDLRAVRRNGLDRRAVLRERGRRVCGGGRVLLAVSPDDALTCLYGILVDASCAITERVARAYCSYVLSSIPVGGWTSVCFAPISAQLVDSTVPPLS